jgi:hypothetical protein
VEQEAGSKNPSAGGLEGLVMVVAEVEEVARGADDVQAEEHRLSEVAEEVESWPPAEAGHGEEPTWAGMAGCDPDR